MPDAPLQIVFATRNLGKVRELASLTAHLPLDIRPATDWPDFPDIPETGDTFAENAALKARAAAAFAGCAALADDSGLEVDALDGAPGVRSARYSDPGATPQRNTDLLLSRIRSVPWPERTARFRCVMAFFDPTGGGADPIQLTEGICRGYILEAPKGSGGFGYDPVFYTPRWAKTFAEIPLELKNTVSHRARAMARMADYLKTHAAGMGRPA